MGVFGSLGTAGRKGPPSTCNLPKNRTKTGLLGTGDGVEGSGDGLREAISGQPLRFAKLNSSMPLLAVSVEEAIKWMYVLPSSSEAFWQVTSADHVTGFPNVGSDR